jgi:hypothetical protein
VNHKICAKRSIDTNIFLIVLNLIFAIFSNVPMTARPAINMVTASLATLQLIEFFNSANNHCKPIKDY